MKEPPPVVYLASSEDTNGVYALVQLAVQPGDGPVMHRHSREDEGFVVLRGEITFTVDGAAHVRRAGEHIFAARGTAHTYRNSGDDLAVMLVLMIPGGMERMFKDIDGYIAARMEDATGEDAHLRGGRLFEERLREIAGDYGLELLGA